MFIAINSRSTEEKIEKTERLSFEMNHIDAFEKYALFTVQSHERAVWG